MTNHQRISHGPMTTVRGSSNRRSADFSPLRLSHGLRLPSFLAAVPAWAVKPIEALVITDIFEEEFLTKAGVFLKLANGSNPGGVACV